MEFCLKEQLHPLSNIRPSRRPNSKRHEVFATAHASLAHSQSADEWGLATNPLSEGRQHVHEEEKSEIAYHVSHVAVEVGQNRRRPGGDKNGKHANYVTNGKPKEHVVGLPGCDYNLVQAWSSLVSCIDSEQRPFSSWASAKIPPSFGPELPCELGVC